MIRGVRQGTRFGAAILALGLLMGPTAVSAAQNNDDAETQAQREVAQVKLELKLDTGRVVKLPGDFTVEWGVQNALEIEADGSKHQFSVTVEKKGEGKKAKDLKVTVGYDRDGEAIIAPYSFETKAKKREVVRVEGGLAFALTITPKTLAGEGGGDSEVEEQPEEPKEPPRDKIEIAEDENDPLGGL